MSFIGKLNSLKAYIDAQITVANNVRSHVGCGGTGHLDGYIRALGELKTIISNFQNLHNNFQS